MSFTFRVARPEIPAGVDAARVNQLIDRARDAGGRRALAIELVAPGEPADLRLTVEKGRLWAVPEGQPLLTDPQRPGMSISLDLGTGDGALAGALRRILWSMARATNLVRIASADVSDGETPVVAAVEISRETDPASSRSRSAIATRSAKRKRRSNSPRRFRPPPAIATCSASA